jgi:hypothetical protein
VRESDIIDSKPVELLIFEKLNSIQGLLLQSIIIKSAINNSAHPASVVRNLQAC